VRVGLSPRYALSALGAVHPLISDNGDVSIAIPVTQQLSSLVTLEMTANDVRFLENRSPGRIVSVDVPPFEALSNNGRMTVEVINVQYCSIMTVEVMNVPYCSRMTVEVMIVLYCHSD